MSGIPEGPVSRGATSRAGVMDGAGASAGRWAGRRVDGFARRRRAATYDPVLNSARTVGSLPAGHLRTTNSTVARDHAFLSDHGSPA
jgi:hypothetical protein